VTDVDDQVRGLVEGMRESIEAFDVDRLPIDRLVWELKSRLAALQQIADTKWVEELSSIRNQLEVVSAFFIESGRSSLSEEEHREVGDILAELRAALIPY
jgi:hypothetical protein